LSLEFPYRAGFGNTCAARLAFPPCGVGHPRGMDVHRVGAVSLRRRKRAETHRAKAVLERADCSVVDVRRSQPLARPQIPPGGRHVDGAGRIGSRVKRVGVLRWYAGREPEMVHDFARSTALRFPQLGQVEGKLECPPSRLATAEYPGLALLVLHRLKRLLALSQPEQFILLPECRVQ